MPYRLREDDMEESLQRREAECQTGFCLSVWHSVQRGFVDVGCTRSEVHGKGDNRHDIRGEAALGEHHVEEHEQQYQFGYAGDEAVVDCGYRACPTTAALSHPIDDDAEERAEEDSKERDDERLRQAFGDELPAILRQQVFLYGMLTACHQALFSVFGFAVYCEIGAVEIVVGVAERELLQSFGGNEHAAGEEVGLVGFDGHNRRRDVVEPDVQGSVEVVGEFAQQIHFQSVPLVARLEREGSVGGDIRHPQRLAFGRHGDAGERVGIDIVVVEPVVDDFVVGAVGSQSCQRSVESVSERRVFFLEHERRRVRFVSAQDRLDSLFAADVGIEGCLVVNQQVCIAVQQGLESIGERVVTLQLDVGAGRQLDVIAPA